MEDISNLSRLLLVRLERISADSVWAHRASGVRGSLIRMMENAEHGESISTSDLKRLMDLGFHILQKAAEEKLK